MKVWGIGWMGTRRRIVAARSKKRAAELVGTTLYHFNEYASETGNSIEVALALASPETVFESLDNYQDNPWKEVKK